MRLLGAVRNLVEVPARVLRLDLHRDDGRPGEQREADRLHGVGVGRVLDAGVAGVLDGM